MFNKTNFLEEILTALNNNNDFYQNTLNILYRYYQLLNDDVFVGDYYVGRGNHYISLELIGNKVSFELNLSKKYLEFRFFLIESMYFNDDLYFAKNIEILIESFFKGLYKIIYHYDTNDEILSKELHWDNYILKRYNFIDAVFNS